MENSIQTINLKEIRKEYLAKFIVNRRLWEQAKIDGTPKDVHYFYYQMLMYASLVDLTTRLQNELKGRNKK